MPKKGSAADICWFAMHDCLKFCLYVSLNPLDGEKRLIYFVSFLVTIKRVTYHLGIFCTFCLQWGRFSLLSFSRSPTPLFLHDRWMTAQKAVRKGCSHTVAMPVFSTSHADLYFSVVPEKISPSKSLAFRHLFERYTFYKYSRFGNTV